MSKYILAGLLCALGVSSLSLGEFYEMDFQDLKEEITIDVNLDGQNYNVPVGTLHFESPDITGSVYGFCSQAHVLAGDQLAELKYIMDYDQYSQDQLRKAGYVVQNFMPEVYNQPVGQSTQNTYAAAVQALIWEILEETNGNYDLDSGVIQFDGGSNFAENSEVWLNFEAYFQAMLTSLSGMSPDFMPNSDIKAFQMDGTQDFITVTALPEPATIAVLGLGGLFIKRRKRI
jgi:hypothetical protein